MSKISPEIAAAGMGGLGLFLILKSKKEAMTRAGASAIDAPISGEGGNSQIAVRGQSSSIGRILLPIGVGLGVGLLLYLKSRKDAKTAIDALHGIDIVDDQIILEDWNAWMEWAPVAVEDARRDGAETGEEIASSMFRRIFPERAWPPAADDPIVDTWRLIVFDIQKMVPTLEEEEREHAEKVIPIRSA